MERQTRPWNVPITNRSVQFTKVDRCMYDAKTPSTAMAPRLIKNRIEMASLLQIEHLISVAGMKRNVGLCVVMQLALIRRPFQLSRTGCATMVTVVLYGEIGTLRQLARAIARKLCYRL